MPVETNIPPPSFPLVAQVNQAYTDFVFRRWFAKNFPGYEVEETGGLRTQERNAQVGGANNSAHLHGLAKDFAIKKSGRVLSVPEHQALYTAVVVPTWPGFTEFDPSNNHIHVNLTREITPIMTMAVGAAAVIAGAAVVKLLAAEG